MERTDKQLVEALHVAIIMQQKWSLLLTKNLIHGDLRDETSKAAFVEIFHYQSQIELFENELERRYYFNV
jgi:hypothetical protein